MVHPRVDRFPTYGRPGDGRLRHRLRRRAV